MAGINTATKADENQVIDVITLAFSGEPAARFVYPNAPGYVANWPAVVKAFGSKAFEHGTAYYVDGFLGGALWLPPNVHADEEGLGALFQETVPEEDQEVVFAVLEEMGNSHPDEPHWYLPLIGVDPIHQDKGYGSALMQHALIQCDRNKELAYLDCSNAPKIPFYQKHGFEVVKEIQIGSSPPIYPMIRTPQ